RLNIGDLERVTLYRDFGKYHPPSHLSLLLTHRNIWLDGFIRNQSLISELHCSMNLKADSKGCLTKKDQQVLFFSESFKQKISNLEKQGYVLKKASINHIIYWYKQEVDKEFMVVLPQVYLEDKR